MIIIGRGMIGHFLELSNVYQTSGRNGLSQSQKGFWKSVIQLDLLSDGQLPLTLQKNLKNPDHYRLLGLRQNKLSYPREEFLSVKKSKRISFTKECENDSFWHFEWRYGNSKLIFGLEE